MPKRETMAEAVGFSVTSLLELWTLNGTAIGLDTIYRFINASNSNNMGPVVFNGVSFSPFPIRCEGLDRDARGSLPKPRLTVSNIGGYISALLLANGKSLDGATVTRQRVHARFIDAVNFPANEPLPSWVTPDPTAAYAPEPFQIMRKTAENPQIVQWELATVIDVNNARLPRHTIMGNICIWKYRDSSCGYSGPPVADRQNRLFTGSYYAMAALTDQGEYDAGATYNRSDYVTLYSDLPQFSGIPTVWVCLVDGTAGVTPATTSAAWAACQCAKSTAACKLRFDGVTTPLRTSAFPGASRADWVVRGR